MAIASKQIQKVFPCVNRQINPLESSLLSEENITNIIKSISDRDSFIISYSKTSGNCRWEVILDGYYIDFTYTPNNNNNLYVILNINSDTKLLKGDTTIDIDTSEFGGLTITESIPAEGVPYLHIYDGITAPTESFVKFNPSSLPRKLDCGELA